MEEGQTDSLKGSHNEQGPKRRSPKIGNGGQGEKGCAGNHEDFFRDSQKRSTDERPESQCGDEEDSDENADFRLFTPGF
jgi:hypothetical protein